MLGKLLKDELKSYRFPMGVVLLAGLIFTVFMKVICMIPYREEVQIMVQGLGIAVYIMVLCLMAFAVQILMIIRFYSTMVGDRAYLTWTLPASSHQHIGAKLLGSVIWKLIVGLGMLVMLGFFFVGKYWIWMEDLAGSMHMQDASNIDIIKWIIQSMIQEIWGTIEPQDILMICVQGLSAFVWSITALLMIYMCIAIGQLFGKWRILMSIGSYFGIMILLEIVSTVALTVIAWYNENRVGMVKQTMVLGYASGMWVTAIASLLISLVTGVALFLITNYIFKNHLNLE